MFSHSKLSTLLHTQAAATRGATEPQQSDRRQRRPRYKPIDPVETAPLAAVISILIQRHRAIPDVRQRALALHFLVDATPIGEVLLFITENSNEIFLDTTLPAATEEHPEQHVRGGFELEQAVALGGIWWKFIFSWPSQVQGLMQALNPSDGSGSSAGVRAGVGKANGGAPSVVPAMMPNLRTMLQSERTTCPHTLLRCIVRQTLLPTTCPRFPRRTLECNADTRPAQTWRSWRLNSHHILQKQTLQKRMPVQRLRCPCQ
jgi:hypothetical protein